MDYYNNKNSNEVQDHLDNRVSLSNQDLEAGESYQNFIPDMNHTSNDVANNSKLTLDSLYGTSTASNKGAQITQPNQMEDGEPSLILENHQQQMNQDLEDRTNVNRQNKVENPSFSSLGNHKLEEENQNTNQDLIVSNHFSNQKVIHEEELLKTFIGQNYDKITTRPFNFAGFIFSSLYMFYRKMFFYALCVFVLNIIIINFIKVPMASAIFHIILGLTVNKIYIFFAKKKIAKIKLENQEKTESDLKTICSNQGGGSIGFAILGLLIQSILAILMVVMMFILGIASVFGNLFSIFGKGMMPSNGIYDGVLTTNPSIEMSQEFSMTVPPKFQNNSTSNEYLYKFSSNVGVLNECSVHLFVPEGYSDAQNLINQMAKYNSVDNPPPVTKTNINNRDWYSYSTNQFGKEYYYATTKNGKVFLLEYIVEKDTSSDCEIYQNQIINSIKSK